MTPFATLSPRVNASAAAAPASLRPQDLGYASAVLLALDFAKRMRAHGLPIDTHALLTNPAYASEQVSLGHTQACQRLRAAAMRLFELHSH
jgi:hypothetical protein